MDPELLVNISVRLPQSDRKTLAEHLAPLMKEVVAVGGITVNISMQPYDPDGDD